MLPVVYTSPLLQEDDLEVVAEEIIQKWTNIEGEAADEKVSNGRCKLLTAVKFIQAPPSVNALASIKYYSLAVHILTQAFPQISH